MSPRAAKLRQQLTQLKRNRQVTGREMSAFAKSLGRTTRSHRTGEPVWISDVFPDLPSVSIPNHSVLKIGTKQAILKELEQDVERHEDAENGAFA